MSFQKGIYLAHSPGFMAKDDLESTGQVDLPVDVINNIDVDRLGDRVMQFAIRNPHNNVTVYAGVHEFKGNGTVTMPLWMMDYIGAVENTKVEVSLVNLRKALRVVFQPQDEDFNKLNVRAVLEVHLRTHFCLTQGTLLPIKFGKRIYKLKVLKTEPDPGVLLFHSDVITEFATPSSQFTHHWNDPDTDSSDQETKTFVGRTIKGKTITIEKRPQHSTVASRAEALKLNPSIMGIRKIEHGQEVAAPHPKAKLHPNPTEKQFQGTPHMIKKKKSKKEPVPEKKKEEPVIIPDDPDSPAPVNPFQGTARCLKPKAAPAKAQPPAQTASKAPNTQITPKTNTGTTQNETAEPKPQFVGKARTLKGN